jgi:hypothetical protein
LPRITDEERVLMLKWLQKENPSQKMLNARWIKGGGAKGASMVGDSKAVKTSGAYEALAAYVNERLQSKPKKGDKSFWTAEIARTRFTSIFKSYTDACKIGSKADSAVGASAEEIAAAADFNASLLHRQTKKYVMFASLHALYSEHPTVNPVLVANGGQVNQGTIGRDNGEDDDTPDLQAHVEGSKADEKNPNKGSADERSKAASKSKNESFKLKEGSKRPEFTAVWGATTAAAKRERLEFDKENAKKQRIEQQKDRQVAAQKIKTEFIASLLSANKTTEEIKELMILAGY